MSLWADKYRPCSLSRLDYHKEQAAQLRNLVSERGGARGARGQGGLGTGAGGLGDPRTAPPGRPAPRGACVPGRPPRRQGCGGAMGRGLGQCGGEDYVCKQGGAGRRLSSEPPRVPWKPWMQIPGRGRVEQGEGTPGTKSPRRQCAPLAWDPPEAGAAGNRVLRGRGVRRGAEPQSPAEREGKPLQGSERRRDVTPLRFRRWLQVSLPVSSSALTSRTVLDLFVSKVISNSTIKEGVSVVLECNSLWKVPPLSTLKWLMALCCDKRNFVRNGQ